MPESFRTLTDTLGLNSRLPEPLLPARQRQDRVLHPVGLLLRVEPRRVEDEALGARVGDLGEVVPRPVLELLDVAGAARRALLAPVVGADLRALWVPRRTRTLEGWRREIWFYHQRCWLQNC